MAMLINKVSMAAALTTLFITGFAFGGDGHDHGQPPVVSDGKSMKVGDVEFFNLGEKIEIGTFSLERKIAPEFGIVYVNTAQTPVLTERLNVKTSAAEGFAGLDLKDVVKTPQDSIELKSPQLEPTARAERENGLDVRWTPSSEQQDLARVQIVLEALSSSAANARVIGRVTIETKDFGDFKIEPQTLRELPVGPARFAIKRIRGVGLKIEENKLEIVTIFSAASRAGLIELK